MGEVRRGFKDRVVWSYGIVQRIFPLSGAEVGKFERDCKSCHPSVIFLPTY